MIDVVDAETAYELSTMNEKNYINFCNEVKKTINNAIKNKELCCAVGHREFEEDKATEWDFIICRVAEELKERGYKTRITAECIPYCDIILHIDWDMNKDD